MYLHYILWHLFWNQTFQSYLLQLYCVRSVCLLISDFNLNSFTPTDPISSFQYNGQKSLINLFRAKWLITKWNKPQFLHRLSQDWPPLCSWIQSRNTRMLQHHIAVLLCMSHREGTVCLFVYILWWLYLWHWYIDLDTCNSIM